MKDDLAKKVSLVEVEQWLTNHKDKKKGEYEKRIKEAFDRVDYTEREIKVEARPRLEQLWDRACE